MAVHTPTGTKHTVDCLASTTGLTANGLVSEEAARKWDDFRRCHTIRCPTATEGDDCG
jgi:hypothetical protein